MIRVPVVSYDGKPLMPTKSSRARRWVKEGKAVGKWSNVGIYYVQLGLPTGEETQPVVVGVDPGKSYAGIGIQSAKFTLARFHFTSNTQGYIWSCDVNVTDSMFKIITRPGAVRRGKEYGFFRRQLHFEVPDKSGTRKRKGGTITPFGFRVGDLVKASKSKEIFVGYIGGFTNTDKTKNVAIYDHTWKRIGQFTPSKVKLLRRSNGLCLA